MSGSASEVLTPAVMNNMEAFQGAIKIEAVYHDASISSSTDPFAGKTNKYAEARVVRVIAQTKGVHVLWGGSGVGAADGDDYLVLADTYVDFVVDPDNAYLRLIEESASAEVYVVELT